MRKAKLPSKSEFAKLQKQLVHLKELTKQLDAEPAMKYINQLGPKADFTNKDVDQVLALLARSASALSSPGSFKDHQSAKYYLMLFESGQKLIGKKKITYNFDEIPPRLQSLYKIQYNKKSVKITGKRLEVFLVLATGKRLSENYLVSKILAAK